jgi:hypothetical protein
MCHTPPDWKQKSKVISANSSNDVPIPERALSENSTAGPPNHMEDSTTITEVLGDEARPSMMPLAD